MLGFAHGKVIMDGGVEMKGGSILDFTLLMLPLEIAARGWLSGCRALPALREGIDNPFRAAGPPRLDPRRTMQWRSPSPRSKAAVARAARVWGRHGLGEACQNREFAGNPSR